MAKESKNQSNGNALQESAAPFAVTDAPNESPEYIVAIGASAGGLDPLEQVFAAMPTPNAAGFVVVQHLSPDFKSLMDELLLRHTDMPIRQATDNTKVLANTIYLMPPRKNMTIENGILKVEDAPDTGRLMLPIDKFISSLAKDLGEHAVAIILSGTGSDGSIGAKEVSDAGGHVIVQEPASCKFDGMPRNALNTVSKAITALPGDIPSELAAILGGDDSPQLARMANRKLTPFEKILTVLRRQFRTDFGKYKSSTILRRIERRAQMKKLESIADYAEYIKQHEEECDELYCDLLIGVTSFFRDPEAFDELAIPLESELKKVEKESRPLRIWVPGCATGEEAYTLAMLLHDRCEKLGLAPNIKIFATDLHPKSLEIASSGRYSEESIKNIPAKFMNRYFDKNEDSFQISAELRRYVVFSRQDLVSDPPFTRIDLVSCRNVLIYISEDAQKRVLSLFHFALRKNGLLFLGPSESLGGLLDEFDVINSKWRIYRKTRDVRLHENHAIHSPSADLHSITTNLHDRQVGYRGVSQRYLLPAYEMLLTRHAPPSLLIDRTGDLAHVFGNAKDYLSVNEGIFTQRLLDHIHTDLKAPLSGIIERAWRQMDAVSARCLMRRSDDTQERVSVHVSAEPLTSSSDKSAYLLLTFEPEPPQVDERIETGSTELTIEPAPQEVQALAQRVQSLERDLMFTEESLQSVIEELETSNEELQATNEELMASNEELQSTNEELHSVNEELYTVSAEHQQKIDELTQLGADMDNLLRSTDIGTIFVDQKLHIRRYTPAIAKIFNLLDHDIGRPIEHITFRFKDEHLHRDIRHVLNTGEALEREVDLDDEQVFFMRILPYLDGTNRQAGVVLTFVNIAPIKRAEESNRRLELELVEQRRSEAERNRDQLFALLDDAPLLISVHEGADHKIVLANKQFKTILGDIEQANGQALESVLPKLCENGGRERFERVLASGEHSLQHDINLAPPSPNGDIRHFSQILVPYLDPNGQRIGVINYAFDVTAVSLAKREAESLSKALQDQRERLELAFSVGRMGYCTLAIDRQIMSMSSNLMALLDIQGDQFTLTFDEFADRLTTASRADFQQCIERTGTKGSTIDVELQWGAPKAKTRWLRLFGRPKGSDINEWTIVIADVSAVKSSEAMLSTRAAELEAANSQLEQVLSVASHDLKSPLRGIHNLVRFMRDDLQSSGPSSLYGYMDRIAEQSSKMSLLLNDLLEYAQQDTGNASFEPLKCEELVHEAFEIVGAPTEFRLNVKPNLPEIVTNRAALAMVFRNLLANAVRHHPRADGTVEVRAARQDDRMWAFEIEDNGSTMPEERLAELNDFARDGQAKAPRLGMGLALVKRAVARFGGRLRFAAAGGNGLKVSFLWRDNDDDDKGN